MKRSKELGNIKYMRLALSLARNGRGKVWPNPMVGCVIVNDERIVGKGCHEYFGGPHAEINALTQAGKKALGSTMYVTLEPCNHVGKTLPCTDAIIRAGVKRVVAATFDPNKNVRGKGLRELRDNSIEVFSGMMKREALRLNAAYMKSRMERNKVVIVKAAMSADGKIATRTGDSKWISSRHSRAFVHRLRTTVDAIVVGRNTITRDDPELTSHGAGPNPVRVVLDTNLTVPMSSKALDNNAPTIVFFAGNPARKKLKSLQKRKVMAVRLPFLNGRMDFREIIARLRQFSLDRVLIEGGGETIANAIESGVATDIVLFIAPKIVGGRMAKTPVEGSGIANIRDSIRLTYCDISRIGSDFVLTAKLGKK